MFIIVVDDFLQTLESSIMVEPAFLMAPEPAKRRGAVALVRRAGGLEIIDADFFCRMETPTRLGIKRRRVTGGAFCFSGEQRLSSCSRAFVIAALRWFGRRN